MEIVELAPGDDRLAAAYEVMRELRPELERSSFDQLCSDPSEGYQLVAVFDDGECRAVAGYRIRTNFANGKHLYVDDLVTLPHWRSKSYGSALNARLMEIARDRGCAWISLDSAVHRYGAHRFYFREGYSIAAYHFRRALEI